jgi:CRP-like cAMP-binding protein
MNAPTARPDEPPQIDGALAALARPRRLARRHYAFRQGEQARAVFFVLEGEVQLCRVGRRGERIILHRARPGEWFAEAALWSGRYHCDAVAARPARLLEVPAGAFREALRRDSALAERWIALLSHRLQSARARAERAALSGAEERIRHYLAAQAGANGTVELRGSLKDLAAELGLAHETLYRTLARMQRAGHLVRDGTRLALARPAR